MPKEFRDARCMTLADWHSAKNWRDCLVRLDDILFTREHAEEYLSSDIGLSPDDAKRYIVGLPLELIEDID